MLQGTADLQGFGNGLANTIFGNTGNNLIDGGAGADAMTGGAGNDTYFVDNAGDAVLENAGEGNDAVFLAPSTTRCRRTWRTLVLQGAADLQGFGNASRTRSSATAGNNLLDGGAGADAMIGGAGNDTYFVDNAGDVVIENAGQGNDAVFASVNYALTANVETLVLQGGADLQGFGNGACQLDLRQYRQQPHRWRRRRRHHGRRRRQRHLFRRQCRRRGDRERRPGQRRGLRLRSTTP